MKSEHEFDSTETSKNMSLSLINKYETVYEKIKFPYKKYNYKSFLYMKRTKYGLLSKIGMVNDKLRLLPTLDVHESCAKENTISNLIKLPSEKLQEEDFEDMENSFYLQKLIYNSNFNLNFRKSKREIKLRNMLDERIKQLSELKKS